jgi:hypothetical protein
MVDLGTGTSHLLTRDAIADPTGRYPALCGVAVLPAAMVDPGRRYCWLCRSSVPGSEIEDVGGCSVIPVPPPRFPHKALAGRWLSSPDLAPGGQPDPNPAPCPAVAPRWVRCPVDHWAWLVVLGRRATGCGNAVSARWVANRV